MINLDSVRLTGRIRLEGRLTLILTPATIVASAFFERRSLTIPSDAEKAA